MAVLIGQKLIFLSPDACVPVRDRAPYPLTDRNRPPGGRSRRLHKEASGIHTGKEKDGPVGAQGLVEEEEEDVWHF